MSEGNAQEPAPPVRDDDPMPPQGEPEAPEVHQGAPAPVPSSVPPAERMSGFEQSPREAAARHRDKIIGTVIVIAAFILSLGISLWAKHASRPELSEPPRPPSKEGVVGFPSKVDFVATLPAARMLTRRSMLRAISAEGVRSDGGIDLKEGVGRVRYTFQSPPGHGPQPPREPGTLPRQVYCGKQTVQVRKEGIAADPDRADSSCPLLQAEPLPDPQCSVQDIWRVAIARGAPADRPARIEYFRSKAGPAFRFELPGTKYRFTLHGDCKRELVGTEAIAVQN